MDSSSLSVTAKYIDDLVSYHFLNSLTSRLQVLARIEVIRMLSKVLADCSGHSQTDIRVDVDLANGKLSSLSQLILRNTYCIRHISAVLVDHLNEILRYRRRTMKNDREARRSLNASSERRNEVVAEQGCHLHFLCTDQLNFVSAMARSDCDSQESQPVLLRELLNLFRTCIALMARLNDYLVLDTSQSSQLSLNNYAMCMCVLNNLLGQSDIVLEALRRSVDHDRCESAIDAALAELKAVAVIQMQSDRDLRILSYSSLNQLYQIGVVGISSCSLGNLQNKPETSARRLLL